MCAQTSAASSGSAGRTQLRLWPGLDIRPCPRVRLPISETVRRAQSRGSDQNGRHDRPPDLQTLETIQMKRQMAHPAANPSRLTRPPSRRTGTISRRRSSAARLRPRAPLEPLKIRWMSPRRLTGAGSPVSRRSASESIRGGWAASHAASSASFERR